MGQPFQWQCTEPALLSMWQHCPGGEDLRQPPPCAQAVWDAIRKITLVKKIFMVFTLEG